MNSIVLVFAAALAVAQAGYLHGGVVAYGHHATGRTTHLQGPSASAEVVGNDGSVIVGHAPGAHITATEHVGGAAVGYSAPVVAHHAYAAHAPVVAHHGVVAAHGYAHAPVVAAHGYAALGYAAHGYAHGYEGQYVPDHLESLYDDGSYHGEHYHGEHYY